MPATQHSPLGGSSAYRWLACPGSIRLSEGIPDKPSPYAAEGSAAHAVAEQCLLDGVDAAVYVGTEVHDFLVTDEMAEAVQVYVDFCRMAGDQHDLQVIEEHIQLDALDPPPCGMYGTVDFGAWRDSDRHLHIVDYKHGQGTLVEVDGNVQEMYYALGCVLGFKKRPDSITVTIVQPRAAHPDGPIRSWTFEFAELIGFRRELLAGAWATQEEDALIGPVGDHCKFCPAKAICPAQADNMMEMAQQEFGAEASTMTNPPDPTTLSIGSLSDVLEAAPLVEDWIKAVREHAYDVMAQGGEVPGFKLVEKRKTRKWVNPEQAEQYLRRHLKVAGAFKRTLVSPHQAEQALKAMDRKLPDSMVVAESSGLKLAHEGNPQPAQIPATAATEEFDAG